MCLFCRAGPDPSVTNDVAAGSRSAGSADVGLRKAAEYAAAGLHRYWNIDPEGPEVIVHELLEGVLVERVRHRPGTERTLDVGPCEVTFDPAALVA